MAPDDPIGTVRAGNGILAVRAPNAQPGNANELSWFVIDIGADLDWDDIDQDQIVDWPIVYQP